MSCITLLSLDAMGKRGPAGAPNGYQTDIVAETVRLLTNQLGGTVVRARLGITAKSNDRLFSDEMTVAARALLLYEKRYCVNHPLNNLGDAVENLAHQVRSSK